MSITTALQNNVKKRPSAWAFTAIKEIKGILSNGFLGPTSP
jgi:hypothetical protein